MKIGKSKQKLGLIVLGVFLVLGGTLFSVRFIKQMIRSSRAIDFAITHNFNAGNLDPAIIQPWMSLQYIAEAYAVPQAFFLYRLQQATKSTVAKSHRFSPRSHIDKRSMHMLPLRHIDARLRLGRVDRNQEPKIMPLIRQAIIDYRSAPVATGLIGGKVKDWMNMQYLANCTGIAIEEFFDAVQVSQDGNTYIPLGQLLQTVDYPAGGREFFHKLQQVVDRHPQPEWQYAETP